MEYLLGLSQNRELEPMVSFCLFKNVEHYRKNTLPVNPCWLQVKLMLLAYSEVVEEIDSIRFN
jgi:hypothetical protein